MTTRESVRNALEAAHSFIQEEVSIPMVPEDGDFKRRDSHIRKYVRTIDTVENALRRLDSEMDPEKETLLVGEYREDPSPCPCCGGTALAESGVGRYGWWAQVRCTECGLKLYDTENPKNPAYSMVSCMRDLIGKWNTRAVQTCKVSMRRSDSDYTDEPHYVCSECGGFIPVDEVDPATKMPVHWSKFCPNCGRAVVGASLKGATNDDGQEDKEKEDDNGGAPC